MKWFGKSWDAPICDPDKHAKTPVERACPRCGVFIEEGDQGLIIPHMGNGKKGCHPWHLECFFKSIGKESD